MPTHGPAAPPGLTYQPALDGLRAFAVIAVLLFHLQVPGAGGGYLGVSVFFTLSGFLITRLLTDELSSHGSIDIAGFWARRARRLMPAALAGLGLVLALAATGRVDDSGLRAPVWSALAQVANWNLLLGDQSYADLFTGPTPLDHYWSLSIEEQFYWCWPVAVALLARWAKRRTSTGRMARHGLLWPVVAAFVLTALSAPLTARWSADAAYLATWARAPEILAGAVLALLVVSPAATTGWSTKVARWSGPLLLVITTVMIVTPAGRGWAYQGGLPLFALLSAAFIATLQGPSPVRRALSSPPLVAIGRRSYGIYVYHWPVIVWLDADALGYGGVRLGLTRVAVTFVLAWVSYRWLEQPLRRQGAGRMRPYLSVVVVASLAIAATAAVVDADDALPPAPDVLGPGAAPAAVSPTAPPVTSSRVSADTGAATFDVPATSIGPAAGLVTSPAPGTPPTSRASSFGASEPATSLPAASTPDTTSPPTSPPTVVAIFGDSVPAWMLRDAAPTFDRTDVTVVNGTKEGCDGFDGPLVGRDRRGELLEPADDCAAWTTSYPLALAQAPAPPEIGLLMVGIAPTLDRLVDGEWQHPCDGIDWYTDDLARRIEYLGALDMRVVFALPARPGAAVQFIVPGDYEERYACVRAELGEFLRTQPVDLIDLDEVLCADDCDATRVDGLHLRAELASDVLDWLLDRMLGTSRS